MVWYYAAMQPREVEVRFCKTHASVKWDFTALPFPSLFHVCQESHKVAQKHYTYLFSPYTVGGMPFNPLVDMLYFRSIDNNLSFIISPLLRQLQKWVDNFAQNDLTRHVGLNCEVSRFPNLDGIKPFI